MKPQRPAVLAAFAAAALLAGTASAQEIIQAGPRGAPPVGVARPAPVRPASDPGNSPPETSPPENSPEAHGAWARNVMAHAGQPDAAPADHPPRPGCDPAADRKPHGEVWAGVGTGGYREAGAAVTAPLGDCGQATIVVDKTRGPEWRGR